MGTLFQESPLPFSVVVINCAAIDAPLLRAHIDLKAFSLFVRTGTARHHADGQNLLHHREKGYTVLVFARGQKKRNTVTLPFTCLGPADLVSDESERPIRMVWRLKHPMPVEMFADNRKGG